MTLLSKLFLGITASSGALLAYVLWPSMDPRMEDPQYLRHMVPWFRAHNLINNILWYAKVRNIFCLQRALMTQVQKKGYGLAEGVETRELYLDGVRAVAYLTDRAKSVMNGSSDSNCRMGGIIYFHGGAFVLGSPESHHIISSELAAVLDCLVISVDYRLAPEFTAPAAWEDSLRATVAFLRDGHSAWNVDPSRVVLAGDSAGAFLAASVALKIVNSPEEYPSMPAPNAVALVYPPLQFATFNTPSYLENQKQTFYNRDQLLSYRLIYYQGNPQENFYQLRANQHIDWETRQQLATTFNLPELVHRGPSHFDDAPADENVVRRFRHVYENPYNSPLFGNLQSFPPSFILSCEFDMLRDDSLMMVRRLRAEKREVVHEQVAAHHGMLTLHKTYPPANRAFQKLVMFIAQYI